MKNKPIRNVAMAMGLSVGVATAGGQVALAQDGQAGEAHVLEDIVVTARSRGESVQSVPLAITAFSNADLERRAVVEMADVSRLTPGFTFESFGTGSTSPVIRGATQIAGSTEQPVSFFLDGVYLPREYVTDVGFWGIDRLEVVKGPQSARYGRNAFSGAVNYVTRRPSDQFGAEVETTIGNFDRFDIAGLITGPIVEDKIEFLAGVSKTKFDGSWKNNHPFCDADLSPGTDCRTGGYEKTTYNAALTIRPIERLTIDATYFHFSSKREQPAITRFGELNSDSGMLNCGVWNPSVRPAGAGGLGFGGEWYRLYCGEIPVKPLEVDPRGYGAQLKADFSRIGVSYELTDSVSLSYVFGRVAAKVSRNQYNDHLPSCAYLYANQCMFSTVGRLGVSSESHDVRLSFDNDGIVRFSFGYLYAPSRDWGYNWFASAPVLTAPPTQPLIPGQRDTYGQTYSPLTSTYVENEVSSPFAEVQLSLMDERLRLGAEGRFTREKRFQQNLTTGATFAATYKSFTPRFTVDYDLAPRHLLYASAAKGVKTGGFNTNAFLPENRVYDEDSNWSFEVGSKNTWGNLRINGSLFLIKWQDMQISAADPGNPAVLPIAITQNLGSLTSKGAEVEVEYAVSSRFTLSGTGYYGKATFDDGTKDMTWGRVPGVCDNVICSADGDISGKYAPRAPKWMSTLAGEWRDTLPMSSAMDYYVRGDLTYQSKAFADEMNLAWAPSRVLLNGSVGITADRWEARLWVRNLLDEKYVAAANIQQPNVAYTGPLGDRRTFGLTLSASY